MAYGVGMMLALTRNRPLTEMESISAANAMHSYA
jgi:cell division protein FtsW